MTSLAFGTPQIALLVTFGLLVVFFIVVFSLVARASVRERSFDEVRTAGYRIRTRWFYLLVVVLGTAFCASFFFLPYPSRAADATPVRVVSGQFYWTIEPHQFTRGTRVRFDVTAADVNHGFGIYDPAGHMIGSVQAMPGYHNKLTMTLDQVGSYRVACLEYCGLNHHAMFSDIEVTG